MQWTVRALREYLSRIRASPTLWSPKSLKFSTYKMTVLEDPMLLKALYVLKFTAFIEHFLGPRPDNKIQMHGL